MIRYIGVAALMAAIVFLGLSTAPAPRYAGLDLSTDYHGPSIGIDKALAEWRSKPRRMGCVTAARWFCNRVEGFGPVVIERCTREGESYQHCVAFNGVVVIDLQPLNDAPTDGRWLDQWLSPVPTDLPSAYYVAKVSR